jgi:CIC family chloride channel protein
LVAAGAGAGIGAVFNAPIAGMLFALEVILSSFSTRHLSAIVIASVAAAVTTQTLVGEELAIRTGFHELGDPRELFLYAGLAIVVVAVGILFLRLLGALESFVSPRTESLGVLRPLISGLLVAGLIFLEPGVFGSGQAVTNRLLAGEVSTVWWVLMLLALAKVAATALTLSSGASGGAFMPSLFMGAALGTGFAFLVTPVWNVSVLSSGAFAVVGMAAMFAVVGRAPLTAILLVFEVTGARDYQLILPLMLTATLATFLAERFHPESVYSMALKNMGINVRKTGEIDLLDTIEVGTVMTIPTVIAAPDDDIDETTRQLSIHHSHGAPVVEDGHLIGIITVADVARLVATGRTGKVSDVMTPRPATVTAATKVSLALERMAALGVGRLPVVDEVQPDLLVGVFRREDAVRAYHEALTASTDVELHRARLAQRTTAEAGYYDFRVPPNSIADGRAIHEVSWPEGATLVSIRRERDVIVPNGGTVLRRGDVITAFGTATSNERIVQRLNTGADEPTAEIPISEFTAE